jgi:hypothetical protein
MAKDREKVVYGRPDDAYRMTYLDIMWVEDAKRRHWFLKCPIYSKLDKTIDASLKKCKELWDVKELRSRVRSVVECGYVK